MNLLIYLSKHKRIVLLIFLLILSLYSSYLFLSAGQRGFDTVLVNLAEQFLKWHIALPYNKIPIRDIADYYNNYYVYFGPLSSLMLMPFVLIFGSSTPQVLLGIFSMTVSFIAVYGISRIFKFNILDSLWLSLFFVFSTVLFSSSVVNITAYQVEALGVPFMLMAIWLYLSKRNPLLIGICIGLAIMTRFTLMLSVVFFFLEMLQNRLSLKNFTMIMFPIFISLIILGSYNNRRFHSFFETGYNYSTTADSPPISYNLEYGNLNLSHIPANLYSFLLMAPEPLLKEQNGGMVLRFPYLKMSPWGTAIWFTSPLFFLLISKFKKGKYTISSLITSFVLSLPVILWYSIGYAQIGYRYVLDFLPFLFLALMPSLGPKLSRMAIFLITLGVIINCVYLESIWEIYPLFNIY